MSELVGPVLRMSDDIDGIVAAIRDDNPDREVTVTDRGAYVRIEAPGFLRVTRESVARYLGRDFELRRLENERALIDRWNGQLPEVESGQNGLLLQLPQKR